MMNDYFPWLVGGGLTAVVCVIVAFVFWLAQAQCVERAEMMKLPHRWGPIIGCMVEVEPGRWMPMDRGRWL